MGKAEIEVEVKAEITNILLIKEKILRQGAQFQETKYQHDILLDPPQADFSKTDQVLRIRNSNGNWKLDYKSPRLDTETKSRREYSLKIEDGHQLKDIFSWMNFKIVGEIEKHCETYSYKELKIHLDSVTRLGTFIEVEVMAEETNFSQMKEEIFAFLTELGITNTIKKDYLELMWERGIIQKQ